MYNNDYANGVITQANEVSAETTEKKKRRSCVKICSLLLSGVMFGVAAAGSFAGTNAFLKKKTAAEEQSAVVYEQKSTVGLSTVSYSADSDALSQALDVSDIAEGMMPAMVSITNISVS